MCPQKYLDLSLFSGHRISGCGCMQLPKSTNLKISTQKISVQGPFLEKADFCEPILHALPEWFGIEEANQDYLDAIDRLPTFLALSREPERVIGFLTIYRHFPTAAEIYVAGVHPDYHRRGWGRALLQAAEAYLRKQGIEYLQVKTLSPSNPDLGYAQTRAFYLAMGFTPLEEFKSLWNENNPALLLIKKL
ncbi:MAG TPA: N-acetyltransferase [Chloroflexi bacterium]|nr:N-acetyltransferase [Chloroflexota bacterium]